jgi:replication factor A2
LHYTRGPLDKLGEAGQQAGGHAAGQHDTVMGGAAYGGQDLAAYSGTARKVFKYLSETEQTNEGLHQQEIAANLGLDIAEVARAGDDLLAGGLIYTTVDDQTWAVLEAD